VGPWPGWLGPFTLGDVTWVSTGCLNRAHLADTSPAFNVPIVQGGHRGWGAHTV
jgi:hypothetical protein